MSIDAMKQQLQSYIDTIEDEAALLLLQEAAEAYISKQGDIVDLLTPQQQEKLHESLQQIKDGRITSNTEVSKMARKWLTK